MGAYAISSVHKVCICGIIVFLFW